MPNAKPDVSTGRWLLGLALSSVFTLAYVLTPVYFSFLFLFLIVKWPDYKSVLWVATPLIVSILTPPMASPWLLSKLSPILDYFEYEQIIESKPIDVKEKMRSGTNYILAAQPHGVVTFVAICSAITAEDEFRATFPTGVASAVLSTPFLKNVMGIFNLVSASKQSLKKYLKKGGIEGSIVLYVGGMAELFLSSAEEEVLYLKNRKGFIKLGLQEGVDVVPLYLFGNTSVLSVFKTGYLANMSRKLQVSLTYFWGRWYLPIPRDEKLLYASGQPLGMPQIDNPTDKDIDKWHKKYCEEVTRLFDTYKERVPAYKHKRLRIT